MLTRTRIIIACAAASIALGTSGASAVATTTTTWTVTPGGSITAEMPQGPFARVNDVTTHNSAVCDISRSAGSLKFGSGLPGRHIGAITSFVLGLCSPSITFTNSGFPYHVNARSYNATTGVTSGRLTGIHVAFSVTTPVNCSGVVSGTSATANDGFIPFTYNNTTNVLKLVKGGNLHIYGSTCPGGLVTGDHVTVVAGPYTVSLPQKITSP